MLQCASNIGYYDVVESLIDESTDKEAMINKFSDWGFTALHLAAQHGDERIIELLISEKAMPNLLYRERETALTAAASAGFDAAVKSLLHGKADPDFIPCHPNPTVKTTSALVHAVESNWFLAAQALLEGCATVEQVTEHPETSRTEITPLMIASGNGNYLITELLLNYGADCNSVDSVGNTALVNLCMPGESEPFNETSRLKTMRILIQARANLDHYQSAVSKAQMDRLKASVFRAGSPQQEAAESLMATTQDTFSPLIAAALRETPLLVECLLKHRASVDQIDVLGSTALRYAVSRGCMPVVRTLIREGAKVTAYVDDVSDHRQYMAPELAIGPQSTEMFQYLSYSLTWSSLMRHVVECNPSGVEEALHAGADTTISPYVKTPEFVWKQSRAICNSTTSLVDRASQWSEKNHHLFPPEFRSAVRHILGLQHALSSYAGLPSLPLSLWFKIIAFLPRTFRLPVGMLQPGQRIIIHGLKASPHLNGRHGTVLNWMEEKDRYGVTLPTDNKNISRSLSVRELNLHVASAADAVEADPFLMRSR